MVWGHTWGASKVAKIAKMAIFTTTLIGSKKKIKKNEIFPKSLAYTQVNMLNASEYDVKKRNMGKLSEKMG